MTSELLSQSELLIVEETTGKINSINIDGLYLGQALKSFFNAVPGDVARNKIIQIIDQNGIKDDQWYDINQARLLYYYIGITYGPATIARVGYDIINAAIFPDFINDPTSALQSIDAAYKMNTKGENLGGISTEIISHSEMNLTFTTPFPCNLDIGIMKGCTAKYGKHATVKHISETCRDNGDGECQYHVSY